MDIDIPTMGGPIGLYGFARPKPERADELERLLLSFVAPTRSEPGSLQYQVHRDTADPGLFVFYELWQSGADLQRHLELAHMRDFQDRRMTTCSPTSRSIGCGH